VKVLFVNCALDGHDDDLEDATEYGNVDLVVKEAFWMLQENWWIVKHGVLDNRKLHTIFLV